MDELRILKKTKFHFSTRICWNRTLVASDLFDVYTVTSQSIHFNPTEQ